MGTKKKKKKQSQKELDEEPPQEISVIDLPEEKMELDTEESSIEAFNSSNDTAEDIVDSCKLEPGIHDLKFSQKLKADKIVIKNSEDLTNQGALEVEPVNTVLRKPLEHENKDFDLSFKRKQPREEKTIDSEECISQTVKMSHGQPNLDVEEKLEATTETFQIKQPLTDDKPSKKKVPSIKKDDQKSEEPLFKQGLKLRKTETVKRPIEKAAIEVPKLKHHAFENIPQDVMEEKHSDIKLSRLLPQLTKKKKKKQSPKEMEEEYPEMLINEVPEENIKLDAGEHDFFNDTTDEPDNSTNDETDLVSEQNVKPRLPITQPVERKPKENEPENFEPEDFKQGLKLKKAAILKKPIEKTSLDLPKLKHHEFESVPQEIEAEQVSAAKLSTLLPQLKQ